MTVRPMLRLVAVATLAGVPALFLNFAYNVSPLDALLEAGGDAEGVWRLGLPFFLIVPLAALAARFGRSGRLTKGDRIAAYAAAAVAAGVTLSLYLISRPEAHSTQEIASMTAPLVMLAAGAWLFLRVRRAAGPAPLVALEVPYLANMLLCLIAFQGEWQAGAWCALAATAATGLALAMAPRFRAA
jgi:hypothetical protein